jgi:ketosteroid isomerase-like protein
MSDGDLEELRELVDSWPEAFERKDRATLERLAHEDAVFTYNDGQVHTREQHLATCDRADIAEHDVISSALRSFGPQTAVLNGRHTLKARLHGEHIATELKERALQGTVVAFTQVWARPDGEWRLVSQDVHVEPVAAHEA